MTQLDIEQVIDEQTSDSHALQVVDAMQQQGNRIAKLAMQLNYDGSLTVGAIEDEISFYQRRSVEAVLELGKRLLLLKEMTPHGEFISRIEKYSITPRMAQRFMSSTLKFSNASTSTHLKIGSTSKLLELLILDDDEIQELSEGGAVGDITLDDIERMSVRELKKALRDAKADKDATASVLAAKNQKIDELDAKLNRKPTAKEQLLIEQRKEAQALDDINTALASIVGAIHRFHAQLDAIGENNQGNATITQAIADGVTATYQRLAKASLDLEVMVNFQEMVTPSWMTSSLDGLAELEQDAND